MNNDFNLLENILGSDAYWSVNKYIARRVGLREAIVLSEILYKRKIFRDKLDKDGFFYESNSKFEKETTFSPYEQRKIIDNLKKVGFIEVKLKGIPATNHFKIHDNVIIEFLKTA